MKTIKETNRLVFPLPKSVSHSQSVSINSVNNSPRMSNNPKTLFLLAAERIGNGLTFVALAEALGIGSIHKSVDLTHEYYIGVDSKSHEVYYLNIFYHLMFLPDFRFMVT